MAVKKLSIKQNKKTGKLKIHKKKPKEEQVDIEEAIAEAEEEDALIEDVEGTQVVGVVTKDGEVIEQEVIPVPQPKPSANVGFGIDRTVNLGNYENVKFHVAIHVPSEVDENEIEANYEFVKGWCEMKMTEVLEEYTDED